MSKLFSLFGQSGSAAGPVRWILAGLGNPGAEYVRTRHNAGFLCMDYLSQKLNVPINRLRFSALTGEAVLGGSRVLLMKPQTFMNKSGEAVRAAADFYKIPAENIIIIYDDISLVPGRMRVRRNGSAGGHNGIKSIIEQLGSQDFPRIKIGVGSPPPQWNDLADWVLGNIPKEDQQAMYARIEDSLPCAEKIIAGDTEGAMNIYNQKKEG